MIWNLLKYIVIWRQQEGDGRYLEIWQIHRVILVAVDMLDFLTKEKQEQKDTLWISINFIAQKTNFLMLWFNTEKKTDTILSEKDIKK